MNCSETAIEWLASGERGTSSETIFGVMTGIPVYGRYGMSHPWDPDDFQRCEKLLRAVPEFRERLAEMSSVSPIWSRLVAHWPEIVSTLEREVPGVFAGSRGRAPKTYDLMRRLIEEGRSEERC